MRVFDHPNINNFRCPICGTADDKPVVLIGIAGTERGGIAEATQFHLDCIDLTYHVDYGVIGQKTKKEGTGNE